jgi:hypothetical protein
MTLKGAEKVFSIEQRKITLQLYDRCKSVIEGLNSKIIKNVNSFWKYAIISILGRFTV